MSLPTFSLFKYRPQLSRPLTHSCAQKSAKNTQLFTRIQKYKNKKGNAPVDTTRKSFVKNSNYNNNSLLLNEVFYEHNFNLQKLVDSPETQQVHTPTDEQVAVANIVGLDPKQLSSDGIILWPPNDGFDGKTEMVELPKGTRIDRYGSEYGYFLAPANTSFEKRALPSSSRQSPLAVYEVAKPFKVLSGTAASWFDGAGGGIQYKLEGRNVREMIEDGYLKKVE